MKKIVIASACRTAIGKFGGTLSNVPAAELGAVVIKEALQRANVKPEQVDRSTWAVSSRPARARTLPVRLPSRLVCPLRSPL